MSFRKFLIIDSKKFYDPKTLPIVKASNPLQQELIKNIPWILQLLVKIK